VINHLGIHDTKALNPAAIKPVRSATPIPNITTNTIPNGGKLVKVTVIEVNMRCNCSPLNKFTALIVSFVPGCTTLTPNIATNHEANITITINNTNKVIGWGNLLPARSTPFKSRIKNPDESSLDMDSLSHPTIL
jgi:hypothetical protein